MVAAVRLSSLIRNKVKLIAWTASSSGLPRCNKACRLYCKQINFFGQCLLYPWDALGFNYAATRRSRLPVLWQPSDASEAQVIKCDVFLHVKRRWFLQTCTFSVTAGISFVSYLLADILLTCLPLSEISFSHLWWFPDRLQRSLRSHTLSLKCWIL